LRGGDLDLGADRSGFWREFKWVRIAMDHPRRWESVRRFSDGAMRRGRGGGGRRSALRRAMERRK